MGLEKPLHAEQAAQEELYRFPYHYIPRWEEGFSQAVILRWGYEYAAYMLFVLDRVAALEPASLLDVGCGDGRLTYELGRRLPSGARLLGIDYSERAIGQARAMNPAGEYRRADILGETEVAETFDVVTLVETLEHIPPDGCADFVAGLRRRLAPGGRLVLTVPTTNVTLHPKHYRHFTLDSLGDALAPHFEIREHVFINRDSRWLRLAERLLNNRLYMVREPRLLAAAFAAYRRRFLLADPGTARRLFADCVAI